MTDTYALATARIIAAMGSAVGAVPGCHTSTLSHANATASGRRQINLHVTGRSPSLHARSWYWTVVSHIAGDVDAACVRALDDIADRLALQRERADASLALGHAHPLTMNAGYAGMDRVPIGHLTMDASALALRFDEHPSATPVEDEVERLRALVMRINHAPDLGDRRVIREGDASITDRRVDDRRLDVRTLVPLPHGRAAHITGEMLLLPDTELPDTLLSVLGGRPLADLAVVHPTLDARIISRVSTSVSKKGGRSLRITLKPCRIPISEIETQDDARRPDTARAMRDALIDRIAGAAS